MLDLDKVEQAARCLKVLSHPLRLGILCALMSGEQNVQSLESQLGTSLSNISQHLAQMRANHILVTRKVANQVFYRVADPKMADLLAILKQMYCPDVNDPPAVPSAKRRSTKAPSP
jgi:DNA-binding transcriptional ArsR family regulator